MNDKALTMLRRIAQFDHQLTIDQKIALLAPMLASGKNWTDIKFMYQNAVFMLLQEERDIDRAIDERIDQLAEDGERYDE